MADWEPLDERELLREDQSPCYENVSPSSLANGQGPSWTGGMRPAASAGVHEQASTSSSAAAARHSPRGRDLTREMVLRALEQKSTRRRPAVGDDPDAEDRWLAQQSHLHLNGMNIGRIANLRGLTTLEVLYLYDNKIEAMENLAQLKKLSHLYLSNNNIQAIAGLAGLNYLQKLYLDGNCLQVVSGLEGCPCLEELHISNQRLPPGAALSFDPSSVAAMGKSLRVLVAAHCGITAATLSQLKGLSKLRRLDLPDNSIDALPTVEQVLAPAALLTSLDLRQNPVTKADKYRDRIILMADKLATLDDVAVTQQQREFLLRLQIRRLQQQMAADAKAAARKAAAAAAAAAGPEQGTGAAAAAAALVAVPAAPSPVAGRGGGVAARGAAAQRVPSNSGGRAVGVSLGVRELSLK